MNQASNRITEQLMAMAQLMPGGDRIDKNGANFLSKELSKYDEMQVHGALLKCFRELKFFPTVSQILERLEDGRPGAEEAWAMMPKEEHDSVIWSDEMQQAFFTAAPLLSEGDAIAARMAFKELYLKLITDARLSGKPVKWTPSFGTDKSGRVQAVIQAMEKKRIGIDHAVSMYPELPEAAPNNQFVIEFKKQQEMLLLENTENKKVIKELIGGFANKKSEIQQMNPEAAKLIGEIK